MQFLKFENSGAGKLKLNKKIIGHEPDHEVKHFLVVKIMNVKQQVKKHFNHVIVNFCDVLPTHTILMEW